MRKVFSFLNLFFSTIAYSSFGLLISPWDREGQAMHGVAKAWAANHLRVAGIKISLQGLEHLPPAPFILMGNHQSALDIYTLQAGLPFTYKWLAKRELFFIPFLGWAMKMAGHVSIDRGKPREALKAIDEAGRKIRGGMNLFIFPEGTRSEDGNLLPFKQGVFNLALRAGVPIVPVGICGTRRLQPKGCFIPKQKGIVYINIGAPVEVAGKGSSAKARLMDEVRDRIEGLTACQKT